MEPKPQITFPPESDLVRHASSLGNLDHKGGPHIKARATKQPIAFLLLFPGVGRGRVGGGVGWRRRAHAPRQGRKGRPLRTKAERRGRGWGPVGILLPTSGGALVLSEATCRDVEWSPTYSLCPTLSWTAIPRFHPSPQFCFLYSFFFFILYISFVFW